MSFTRPAVTSLFLGALLLGCTEPPQPAAPDDDTPTVIPTGPPPTTPPAATDQTRLLRPQLPDDVFFNDPLAIAANRTRIPGAEPKPEPSTPPTTDSPEPTLSPSAPTDWATLLPADLLTTEVARIRDRFAPKLTDVAAFNNSLLDFPPYAAELAALAGIATEHPGDVPWKSDAKHVRDLAAAMLSDELQRGQSSYDQVKQPFDKITLLLDGKRPDDLPPADDATDFALAADFADLMLRFEAAENTLNTTGGSEAVFTQNAPDLARETRVLAALSKIIASDDHGYADDPEFQQYAAAMTQAALDAAVAAESSDFPTFDLARSTLNQSCTACHTDYRTN